MTPGDKVPVQSAGPAGISRLSWFEASPGSKKHVPGSLADENQPPTRGARLQPDGMSCGWGAAGAHQASSSSSSGGWGSGSS